MPPIRSNTNPTGLGTIDDYVERTSTLISHFAGKTSAAKRVFNVIVRRTYNPLLGIPRNGFGRAASEKDPQGTSPASYLGTLPSRRDRAEMDPRMGARSDARMASALRRCPVLVRLVSHARTPARWRSAQTTTGRRMAGAVDRHRSVRELGGGPRRRLRRRLNACASVAVEIRTRACAWPSRAPTLTANPSQATPARA